MEADQILCKFAKIRNGGYASKIASEREKMDDEEEGDKRRSNSNNSGGGGAADLGGGAANGLYGCPSSLIVRVSKATGGKDRHSKVITSRGLRDRRVRLSVNTAIQFYDLQDRLGYDQPSKAVEWLLTAAAGSIAELPPMNSPFPVITKPPSEAKMAAEDGDSQLVSIQSVMDGSGNAATKSSSSETSKGLGVSISRSESRVRARESAKEGAVERDKANGEFASFTELLSGGVKCINGGGGGGGASICRNQSQLNNENSEQSSFFPNVPMDYFSNALSSSSATTTPMQIAPPLLFAAPASHHHELQPFSFASDHLLSATNTVNSSTINRGTLQSNVSSPPPTLHFPPNFFPAANHSHFIPGFDARLQLYDGDANGKNEGRYSEPKRKDKP